ncbi:MAG: divalent-cation tolerance protein CutA [Proteobacteria bacterium]|nr:divalent-cation tolerance protein CutA [Pseudomonadota bacterium]
MTKYIVILVTAPSRKEAKKIADAVLDKKACACVNIINGVKSLFYWKGKIDNAQESLLVIKTKKTAYRNIEKIIKNIHSYTVPEIIALPIVFGSRDYLNWIENTVK